MVPERCGCFERLACRQHESPPQAKETVLGLASLLKRGATAAGPTLRMLVQ